MDIILKPKKVITVLALIIAALLCVHVGLKFLYFSGGHDTVLGLAQQFDFDKEKNIPTLFSVIMLLFASVLLAIIGFAKKKLGSDYGSHWCGLALIFLFIAIDEACFIHENYSEPVRALFNTSGHLYFAWVIPYGCAVFVVLLIYFRFLTQLNNKTQLLFLISGIIYLSGALGFEMLGGQHMELHGPNTIMYSVIVTVEELLEMLGLLTFNYALLTYISCEFKDLHLKISD